MQQFISENIVLSRYRLEKGVVISKTLTCKSLFYGGIKQKKPN